MVEYKFNKKLDYFEYIKRSFNKGQLYDGEEIHQELDEIRKTRVYVEDGESHFIENKRE